MTKNEYMAKIVRLRKVTNTAMDLTGKRVLKSLERAYGDLDRLLLSANKDSITHTVYAGKKAAIRDVIDQMVRDLNYDSRMGIRATADHLKDIYSEATRSYADSKGFQFDYGQAFSIVPKNAVYNVTNRVWSDGRTFSDRIWRMSNYAQKGVNDVLTSGIARGQSAVNMSKDLKQFLLDPMITPGTSWTTAINPSVTGAGTIHYNALRLARTEINNTYRETQVLANGANPLVLGVRWVLSPTHPRPDICDVWAKSDLYGMGEGVYPADKAPIDHPNGFCHLLDVLRPPQEWNKPKQEYEPLDLDKSEILAPVSGLSEGGQNQAWAAYNNVNGMLNNNRFRKAA